MTLTEVRFSTSNELILWQMRDYVKKPNNRYTAPVGSVLHITPPKPQCGMNILSPGRITGGAGFGALAGVRFSASNNERYLLRQAEYE